MARNPDQNYFADLGAVGFAPSAAGPEGARWPVVPGDMEAAVFALTAQFSRSQYWPAEKISNNQFRQLRAVLAHARKTVPFYRARLDHLTKPPSGSNTGPWRRIPIFDAKELAANKAALSTRQVAKGHGKPFGIVGPSVGGRPTELAGTPVMAIFERALMVRNQLWHTWDAGAKIAMIGQPLRHAPKISKAAARADLIGLCWSGPRAIYDGEIAGPAQHDWLGQEAPAYLLTDPPTLDGLLSHGEEAGGAPPNLLGIAVIGAAVEQDLAERCQRIWSVRPVHVLALPGPGIIALQCAEEASYHLQPETLMTEILDPNGKACPVGSPGRVIVTSLQNLLYPLIRYDTGLKARWRQPCACGRTSRVIDLN